ncbi:carbohydrate esterase family 1 protein [Piromyces sp. E2]|nr:carbohydrate esterase family 1 protein [Piromyces sp. E2]|eukprot:OUM70580.1 carbohydrate esterase family 1 protein [Piromyces sp. E2]
MKRTTLLSIISTLFVSSKVLGECFSEAYDYPCCDPSNTYVVYVDNAGKWGIENNDWCGISEENIPSPAENTECWAEKFDYPCCKKTTTKILNIDSNGYWGIEDGEWCGLPDGTVYEKNPYLCWSAIYGTKCCENEDTPVSYTDEFGTYGYENGELCGIEPASSSTTTTTTTSTTTTSTATESGEPYCWAEALGYPCCSSNKFEQVDDTSRWGFIHGEWCGIVDILPGNWSEPTDLPPLEGGALKAQQYMDQLTVENPLDKDYDFTYPGVKVKKEIYSSNFSGSYRPLKVVLPPNYDKNKKYPVLYLLHGLGANESAMVEQFMGALSIPADLANRNMAKEMIIVSPRVNVYKDGVEDVPAGFTTEYLSGFDNFIEELVGSVMPFIEQKYNVLTGRENTAIAGFSMGGRTALYIGYTRPDLFGYVGAFSPAFGLTPIKGSPVYPGLFPSEKDVKVSDADLTPLVTLINWGNIDDIVNPYPAIYHRILAKNNQPHIYIEVKDAHHDDKAFTVGLYNFVRTLFGHLDEE